MPAAFANVSGGAAGPIWYSNLKKHGQTGAQQFVGASRDILLEGEWGLDGASTAAHLHTKGGIVRAWRCAGWST